MHIDYYKSLPSVAVESVPSVLCLWYLFSLLYVAAVFSLIYDHLVPYVWVFHMFYYVTHHISVFTSIHIW